MCEEDKTESSYMKTFLVNELSRVPDGISVCLSSVLLSKLTSTLHFTDLFLSPYKFFMETRLAEMKNRVVFLRCMI